MPTFVYPVAPPLPSIFAASALSRSTAQDLPAQMIIELLRSGQRVPFIARGTSMWPFIPSGSQLEIEPCPAAELRAGEIGAFERRGRVVVHRVIRASAEAVHFQGDNHDHSDGPIPPHQVLGRARVLQRRLPRLRWPRPKELLRGARALLRRLRR